jgi:GNAT superfamily N-acetyltransferase
MPTTKQNTTRPKLPDDLEIRLRPIHPDDAPAMLELHSRMSERTRYLRFFSSYSHVPQSHLHRFVNVDHDDREAFVVLHDGAIVAVGRYDRLTSRSPEAEVALVVEDAYQGRGIGSVLLIHLAQAALANGIAHFVATILPENASIPRMIRAFGYGVESTFMGGLVQLSFALAPTEVLDRWKVTPMGPRSVGAPACRAELTTKH